MSDAEETVGRLGIRIAELENDVKVALRHYGSEMLKTQALEARVKELEAQLTERKP